MNNPPNKGMSRDEELAFVVVEQVLGVTIHPADVGTGDGKPDGWWRSGGHLAYLEVTSLPATDRMREFAKARKRGMPFSESGCAPIHLGRLADYLSAVVSETMANDVQKLNAAHADERHLFLFALAEPDREYFARLSDTDEDGTREPVASLSLPCGITDVWFAGREQRGHDLRDGFTIWVARFNRRQGWTRHQVHVDEQALPGPRIGPDRMPDGWRQPRKRNSPEA